MVTEKSNKFFILQFRRCLRVKNFCLFEDIEKIKKLGLAKGGSLNNAIVVNEKEVLNKDGLRNEKRVR